ncbi:MAG: cytochrome-c oxidase, cbb3-type subunit III [Proteobacteria bacterium]|nr:cytochrome-c oxidase, cbb3-type subunit III [Pseudomonadota bacterium]
MSDNHNSAGGVPTTGHLWDDDLADYINQPPKWWMLGLTASALWVVIYWIMYPAIPLAINGTYFKGFGLPGSGQWTAIKELAADQAELDAVRQPYEDKIKTMTPAAILADDKLSEYVTRSGKVLFSDNCAACHGQNGVGTIQAGKFAVREQGLMAPVLLDDDWLYGGKIDTLYETIANGRQGMMVAHKDSLTAQQIDDVAKYVKAMSDAGKAAADGDAAVAAGKKVFAESDCTACHGADAKGIQAMGSANLTDKIWRFDGSLEGIKQTITYGVNSGDANARVAIMPVWLKKDEQGHVVSKLDETAIKKLAVYVYKFGGGQKEDVAAAPVAAPAEAAPAPEAK